MDEKGTNKSREQIKAERESKKAAKKNKAAVAKTENNANDVVDGCIPMRVVQIQSNELLKDSLKVTKSDKDQLFSETKTKENQEPIRPSTINGSSVPEKSKAQLRAERREKQEAQRAAKAAVTLPQNESLDKPVKEVAFNEKCTIVLTKKKTEKKKKNRQVFEDSHRLKLFSHLILKPFTDLDNMHPAILQLGNAYKNRIVIGSNARCLALLNTFKTVIESYSVPPNEEFAKGLESILVKSMKYFSSCRRTSDSMDNATKHVKIFLSQLPRTISEDEARQKTNDVINTFIGEQMNIAGEAICNTANKKINNGDVILIYGSSSLVCRILLESHKSGTEFSVVVVDAGPWYEGRETTRRLVKAGIECSYVLISAASSILQEVNLVLLGAHSLLSNSFVMGRVGTSEIALLAHWYKVPLLVCCETYKISLKTQTDAFMYNELANPDDIFIKRPGSVFKWQTYGHLEPISITYDVTPPDLVTAVITELGLSPCTIVPVILRLKPTSEIV